jgi:LPXTG-motif cell wall-anchored protein
MNIMKLVAAAAAVTALAVLGIAGPASATPTVKTDFDFSLTDGEYGYYYFPAVSKDGSLVAVVGEYECVVWILDVASGTQRAIDLGCDPRLTPGQSRGDHGFAAFSPDNSKVFVPSYSDDSVLVVDLATDTVTATVSGITEAWVVDVSPDGSTLFAWSYNDYEMYKVDLSTNQVVGSGLDISNDGYMTSMCVSSDGTKIYAPDYDSTLQVIDVATWSLDSPIVIADGSYPMSCEYDNDGNMIVNAYEYDQVARVAASDMSVTLSAEDMVGSLYSVVPSCDTIYLGDYSDTDYLGTADLTTLVAGSNVTVTTNPADSWYGYYGGDRSADGSVVALSGYQMPAPIALITSPECGSSPELPNTGVDTSALAAAGGIAIAVLVAGSIFMIVRRRVS